MRRMLLLALVGIAVGTTSAVGAQEPRLMTVRQVETITNPSEEKPPRLTAASTRTQDGLQVVYPGEDGIVFGLGPAIATENHVVAAEARQEPGGEWSVVLSLSEDATTRLANLTAHLACLRDQGEEIRSQLAIVVDRTVLSAHELPPEIECGMGITGGELTFVRDEGAEARELAIRLGGADWAEEGPQDTNAAVPVALVTLLVLGLTILAARRYRS